MRTADFFDTHPVFTLDEAVKTLAPVGGRSGTVERLKHHLNTGRLKRVSRAVYAVVPPGQSTEGLQPDPYLVAAAVRPDGVFSYHSALGLLGAAHSVWKRHTLFVEKRRKPIQLNNVEICFLEHPGPMRTATCSRQGIRRVEYGGRLLKATGPERTLVEGFRRPAAVGGLEELVNAASGFAVLDLDLLQQILHCYGIANLWAAIGWFLEQFRRTFHVSEDVLERFVHHAPRAPQYLERNRRNGVLAARWNILLPQELMNLGGPDER
ncbi:MAG: type IV toxin-antitoxin system AbiEi family antitoxin [Pseudomonadota bacterium]